MRLPRVLIVDDNPDWYYALQTVLMNVKCEIVGHAKDGEEAIATIDQLQPDAVNMDYEMPREEPCPLADASEESAQGSLVSSAQLLERAVASFGNQQDARVSTVRHMLRAERRIV